MLSAAAIQAVGSAGIIFALLTIRHELRQMRRTEMRDIYRKAFPVYITNVETESLATMNSSIPKTGQPRL
jgi:hypothetical protein